MITNAIGKPTTKAPPIINANAESKLSSAWTARLDMPLLHRAPRAPPVALRMNAKKPASGRCPNQSDLRLNLYG